VQVREGKVKDGLQSAQKALALYKETSDKKSEAVELWAIAQWQLEVKSPQASSTAEAAADIFQDLGFSQWWQAACEALIIEAKITVGKLDVALALAEQGVATTAGSARSNALLLEASTKVYFAQGESEKALQTAKASMEVCRSLGAKSWEANMLLAIAQIHTDSGKTFEAAKAAGGAAVLFRKAGHLSGQAAARYAEAQAYIDSGEAYDGMSAATDARAIAERIGDADMEASALLAIANAQYMLGEDPEETVQMAKDAQKVFQTSSKGKAGEVSALQMIAELYSSTGDAAQALPYISNAHKIVQDMQDEETEVSVLRLMATVNIASGNSSEAARAAAEALKLSKKVGEDDHGQLQTLFLVTQANFEQAKQDEARARDKKRSLEKGGSKVMRPAEEAMALARKIGDSYLTASALYIWSGVARYYFFHLEQRARLEDVIKATQESANLFKESGDRAGEAAATCLAAEICSSLGSFERAQTLVQSALATAQACGDKDTENRAMKLMAQWQAPQGYQPMQMQMMQAQAPAPEAIPTPQVEASYEDASPSANWEVEAAKKGLDFDYVKALVTATAAEAIGSDETLEMDKAFMEVGLDSLGAITFRNKLQTESGMKLPGTLLFDFPTLGEVTNYMVEESAK
jgi:tetratricopeptide (TPR) repeat protein